MILFVDWTFVECCWEGHINCCATRGLCERTKETTEEIKKLQRVVNEVLNWGA